LRQAVTIAQVDEDSPAVVAIHIDPPAQRDFLSDLFRTQLAASMSPKQGMYSFWKGSPAL
jgi:hypothetical protein